MKRVMLLLAMGTLLTIGCSSHHSSNNTVKSENGIIDRISKAYKKGAKHRTTTFKAETKAKKECVEVEYRQNDDGRKSLFKVNIKKRSEEETGNTAKLNYYSNKTQSAKGLRPCED